MTKEIHWMFGCMQTILHYPRVASGAEAPVARDLLRSLTFNAYACVSIRKTRPGVQSLQASHATPAIRPAATASSHRV